MRTTPVAAVLVLALVTAASAAATSKVIARASRLKGTNVWYAQGKAAAPRTLFARLVSAPAQRVKVQWSVVCQKPNKEDPALHLGTSVMSGQTAVRGAATVKLKLPYAKPPSCVATVYATLARNGRLVLQVLQT
jgi:invasion protein IalB